MLWSLWAVFLVCHLRKMAILIVNFHHFVEETVEIFQNPHLGMYLQQRHYSQTSWSFACHIAILSHNVGILIGSLLRASCNSNFCCLSKRFFILEYGELTAMSSSITSVSKRKTVINFPLVVRLLKLRNMLPQVF